MVEQQQEQLRLDEEAHVRKQSAWSRELAELEREKDRYLAEFTDSCSQQ